MPKQFKTPSSAIGHFGAIGIGNMGAAIIRGVAKKLLSNEQIFVTDVDQTKVDELCQELGVHAVETVNHLVEKVDGCFRWLGNYTYCYSGSRYLWAEAFTRDGKCAWKSDSGL